MIHTKTNYRFGGIIVFCLEKRELETKQMLRQLLMSCKWNDANHLNCPAKITNATSHCIIRIFIWTHVSALDRHTYAHHTRPMRFVTLLTHNTRHTNQRETRRMDKNRKKYEMELCLARKWAMDTGTGLSIYEHNLHIFGVICWLIWLNFIISLFKIRSVLDSIIEIW